MRWLAAAAFFLLAGPAQAADAVDVALVMAVDCSGSVDQREFDLQIRGIASALRDTSVLAAIKAGPQGQVAISVMLWAAADEPRRLTGWTIVASESDAQALAAEVEQFGYVAGGGTGIGSAIEDAVGRLQTIDIPAARLAIDVSGDGRESWKFEDPKMFLPQVKPLLKNVGVTVNGLAILSDEPDLADYYRDNVIFGPASFVIEAATYNDFASTIKIKLIRELLPSVAQR